MIGDNLKSIKKHLPRLLLGASLLVGMTTAAKVYAYVTESANIPEKIENTISKQELSEETIKKYQSRYADSAAALKKKNVFMPPVAKGNPVKQVSAIFGNEVMISDKWYKAGDKIGDAEVIEVTSMAVRIKWNDTETTFYPFDSPGAEAMKSGPSTTVVSEKEPDEREGMLSEEPEQMSQEQRDNSQRRRGRMLKRMRNRSKNISGDGSGKKTTKAGSKDEQGEKKY